MCSVFTEWLRGMVSMGHTTPVHESMDGHNGRARPRGVVQILKIQLKMPTWTNHMCNYSRPQLVFGTPR